MTEAVYLLIKRDLYYAPNNHGYTGIKDHAGRYTLEEAQDSVGDGGYGVTMVHEDDAEDYTPACFDDLKLKHMAQKLKDRQVDTIALSEALRRVNEAGSMEAVRLIATEALAAISHPNPKS